MDIGYAVDRTFTVGAADTAIAQGSGSLPVLGTPRLLAWCEEMTCAALADTMDPGWTSVGTRVELDHLAASPVGELVRVRAEVAGVEGHRVELRVVADQARDGARELVARGLVTRVVVDIDRFLDRFR